MMVQECSGKKMAESSQEFKSTDMQTALKGHDLNTV